MKIFLAIFLLVEASSAFTLDCKFDVKSHDNLKNAYRCFVDKKVETTDYTITAVSGKHMKGKSDADVTLIEYQDDYKMTTVPRGATQFFPNLHAMRIRNSAIAQLHGDEFDDVPLLSWIEISKSNLMNISSRLFEKTPYVAHVIFEENSIKHVGYHLFTPLNITQLKFLNFEDNVCVDQEASAQFEILALVAYLRLVCPYLNENLPTTTVAPPDTTTVADTYTTTVDTTVTTTAEANLTTTEDPSCWVGSIEQAVCDLQERVDSVEASVGNLEETIKEEKLFTRDQFEEINIELTRTREELVETQNRLNLAETKIEDTRNELKRAKEDIEVEMQWMRDELLRLTTSPCVCK